MSLLGMLTVYAENGAQAEQAGFPAGGILLIVGWAAIFYFLLIRPQRKKDKEAKQLIEALKVGDQIVTIGGIYGKITQLKDDTMVIETGSINEKSYIRLSRGALKEIVKSKEVPKKDKEVAGEGKNEENS